MKFLSAIKTIFSPFSKTSINDTLISLKNEPITWISCSINHRTFKENAITKDYDFHLTHCSYSLRINQHIDSTQLLFYKSGYLNQELSNKNIQQTLDLTRVVLDTSIDKQIQRFLEALNRKTSNTSISQTEELKALEWLKTSFVVLEKAIIESYSNPDLLFQLQMFIGENPKTKALELRIILFNLDIQLIALESGLLRVIIYDDKHYDLGTSKSPVLMGDYLSQKTAIMNHFIALLGLINQGFRP